MKPIIALMLIVSTYSVPSAHAQGFDYGDLITGLTTIGGGIIGNRTCRDERGVVQLFCTGAGAGLGYILGRAVTDYDERARVGYYNGCMNEYSCGRHQLRDSRNFIEFRQGQRAYWQGRNDMRCRSYTEVVTSPRGRTIHQETKYACQAPGANDWRPVAPDHYRYMRFYNQPNQQNWRMDAPSIVAPAQPPIIIGRPTMPPGPIGGQWQPRPTRPPAPPIIGGPVVNTRPARPQPPVVAGPARPQQQPQFQRPNPRPRGPAPEILPYTPPAPIGAVR